MSRDFASFMASISADSAELKIKELMEILDKVSQIIMNSADQLLTRMMQLENSVNAATGRVVQLESRPVVAAPAAPGAAFGAPGAATPAAPPPPKPAPKPMSPMSARSAIQSELKQLFARRKQT